MIGFEVAEAEDGCEAMDMHRKAKESGHSLDVVIVDLTIPGGRDGSVRSFYFRRICNVIVPFGSLSSRKTVYLLQFVESPFISFSPSVGVAHLVWATLRLLKTA